MEKSKKEKMTTKIGSKAFLPNSILTPFTVLVGEWKTTGAHPYFPGVVLHGRAIFEWTEGGAFLIMRSEIDHPDFPSGISIIGSDDGTGEFFMLYFDERGVSRKYDIVLTKKGLSWSRIDPAFSQRFTISIEDESTKMIGKGEMSQNGAVWSKDLDLTYIKV